MSDNDPHLSHPRPPLKQYKKKKRPRDDGGDEVVDEARTEKKRRKKHREESGAISTVSAPVVEGDLQNPPLETEKKKKKKKEKKHREHGEGGEPVLELVSAEPGAEKKKKKRKRDAVDDLDSAHETSELREDAPRERKKKKDKHAVAEIPETPASTLEVVTSDPPVKKKKKSKEKQVASSPAPANPSDTLFPLPDDFMGYSGGGSDADMTLFPTHPFPNLSSYTSNEDVLRALQDLDVSKIAGVVKTLTDAADAANISMASSAFLPPVPPTASGSSGKTKKHRRTLDLTGPSSSSDPHPGHAHLLANKWMSVNKLAELVESEGLVYKKGKFSAIESKQVNEAVENYRTTRGLSEEDLNLVIFPSEEKKKDAVFWAEITNAVPLRPIIAVYHYVRRTYHPMKLQGKWQPEEDAKVIQAVASFGQKWEKVAKVVGRMATDCRDRYRNHIVNREKRSTGPWSPAEEENLTQIVTQMQKGKSLDNDIFWSKVSQMMEGRRSRQQCRIKWTDSLSKKFKSDGDKTRWSRQDSFILVHKIDTLNVRDDTEIDWKLVPDSEWNLWSAHTLQRRWLTMKKAIKGFEDMTHSEIMDILRVKYPYLKAAKPVTGEFVESEDETTRAGPSTGPGTLAADEGGADEDDSE